MITAIDSNVLIDVILADQDFAKPSAEALAAALAKGSLVVCETVIAEIIPVFGDLAGIEDFFRRTRIQLERTSLGALSRAGAAWDRFRERDRTVLVCRSRGRSQSLSCVACGKPIEVRQHLITDFLIGAHAAEQADQLLTRDRGYFHTYFPDLKLV